MADALDANALHRVVVSARPTHVIHQLTALPKNRRPQRTRAEPDEPPADRRHAKPDRGRRRRRRATHHRWLVRAAQGATPNLPPEVQEAADALQSMESQILEASHAGQIEGVVLRYGLFYSFDTPSTQQMITIVRRRMLPTIRGDRSLLPWIHVEDAVSATVLALDRAPAGGIYDIVDDQPSSFSDIVTALAQRVGAPRPIAVPAWLPRLIAPYMAPNAGAAAAAFECEGKGRIRMAAGVSDHPRRPVAHGAPQRHER